MHFDVTYHKATAHCLEKWENILALKQVYSNSLISNLYITTDRI